jgi:transcriptional regulator with XRE-family HTH domain
MLSSMERLRAWLADTETTQLEFATVMGVSQPTVSDWLSGRTSPTVQKLRGIAAHTGLSIDDLLAPPPAPDHTPTHAAA